MKFAATLENSQVGRLDKGNARKSRAVMAALETDVLGAFLS